MYLFGAYSPITGDHFEFEFPECNGDNFQVFLNQFSLENENEFKIILLDNGAFHKSFKEIPYLLATSNHESPLSIVCNTKLIYILVQ